MLVQVITESYDVRRQFSFSFSFSFMWCLMLYICFRNVPYDWINKQKSNQHWLKKEGEKFLFPGGGTMFPNGVSRYVDLMQDLIPGMKDGTIRTAIDTGCGVSEFYLQKRVVDH